MKVCLIFLMCLCGNVFGDHFLTYIIPCYNCEKWIEQAVESIYEQNLECPFELICTDDRSTDNTYEMLCHLSQKHPEMIVLQHAKNRGGGAARNTCVAHSRGDLIFCLDSDNVLVPNSVQLLINHMDATSSDIVSFGVVQYFRDDFIPLEKHVYEAKEQRYRLIDCVHKGNCPPWSGNYLYTRKSYDLAGGYPELTIDTYGFGFKQIVAGCKMTYVAGTFYWHRQEVMGYYDRSAKSGQLSIDFFTLLLSYPELFTGRTLKLMKKHKELIQQKSDAYWDSTYFLEHRLINLR